MRIMPSLKTSLKLAQLLPNGLGGAIMATDCLHGQVKRDMVTKLRYPAWFPTALGLWKLCQASLNWVAAGAYTPVAQAMMAVQLGGACYTHAVVEGKPREVAGCVVFSLVTLGAQVAHGRLGIGGALALHAALGLLGWAGGYVVSWLGASSDDQPESPVKMLRRMSGVHWDRMRGFDAGKNK